MARVSDHERGRRLAVLSNALDSGVPLSIRHVQSMFGISARRAYFWLGAALAARRERSRARWAAAQARASAAGSVARARVISTEVRHASA